MTNPNTNFCDWANSKEYGDISDLSMSDDEVTGYRYMDSFYIVEYKEDDHVTPEMQNTEYVVHICNTESNFGDDLAAAEMFLWDEFARFELNWKHVSFDTEFGTDYQLNQKQVMDLIDAGFIDASWHNDICPSFDLLLSDKEYEGAYIRCWFDAPEVEDRETEDEQFAVVVMEGGDTLEELVSTNNFLEAMAAIRKYRNMRIK